MSSIAPAPRRARAWDALLSSALLVIAVVLVLVGLFYDALSVFYGDTCPPSTCSSRTASAVEIGAAIAVLLIVAIGTAGTVALIVLSRRGWWMALSTVAVVGITWAVAVVLFRAAVHHPASAT